MFSMAVINMGVDCDQAEAGALHFACRQPKALELPLFVKILRHDIPNSKS
jgi:hypothetical protein